MFLGLPKKVAQRNGQWYVVIFDVILRMGGVPACNQHTIAADPRSHVKQKKHIDKQNCLQLPDGRLQRKSSK